MNRPPKSYNLILMYRIFPKILALGSKGLFSIPTYSHKSSQWIFWTAGRTWSIWGGLQLVIVKLSRLIQRKAFDWTKWNDVFQVLLAMNFDKLFKVDLSPVLSQRKELMEIKHLPNCSDCKSSPHITWGHIFSFIFRKMAFFSPECKSINKVLNLLLPLQNHTGALNKLGKDSKC